MAYGMPVFELGDLRFGGSEPIRVSSFDPGNVEIRTQDSDRAGGDGAFFGRDFFGSQTWTWEIFTDAWEGDLEENYVQALDLAEEFSAVWHGTRFEPNEVMPCRYRIGGRWRRVYGRPRRLVGPDGGIVTAQGRAELTADFLRADRLHYDDEESSITVRKRSSTVGGFLVPFVAPIVLEQPTEGYMPSAFTVGGKAPTYPVIEITEAGADPWVATEDWRLELEGTFAPTDVLTIDTRPWARMVMRNGVPITGVLPPRTLLEDIVLRPGPNTFAYGGWGDSASAQATMRWRNAYYSL